MLTMTPQEARAHIGAQLAIRTADIWNLARTVPMVRHMAAEMVEKNAEAARVLGCGDDYYAASAKLLTPEASE